MESITDLTCPFNNCNCIYECAFWDKREEFCKISEALSIYIEQSERSGVCRVRNRIVELAELHDREVGDRCDRFCPCRERAGFPEGVIC